MIQMSPQERLVAQHMVQEQLYRRGVRDQAVLQAMSQVPRHHFVPTASLEEAYSDHPLPTAQGQTISQPYMVAMMTQLLGVEPGMKVLEIGTGSGYQAAVLTVIGAQVITVERSELLAQRASDVLKQLGCSESVQIIQGDGTRGLESGAPYDRVIVTAAAPHLPVALRDQLADIGRIVIPIGDLEQQHIMVFKRHGTHWSKLPNISCRFVPLIGQDGWSLRGDGGLWYRPCGK